MIRSMCRKIAAVLLVLGWVTLSGFDIVEDLGAIPSLQALTGSSEFDGGRSRLQGSVPLANNIVESANRLSPFYLAFTHFALAPFNCGATMGLRRYSRLHKLYRVFLI
jgi:hypothetical protein